MIGIVDAVTGVVIPAAFGCDTGASQIFCTLEIFTSFHAKAVEVASFACRLVAVLEPMDQFTPMKFRAVIAVFCFGFLEDSWGNFDCF